MEKVAPEVVGISPERLRRIHPVMQEFVDRGAVAGVVTLLARRGKVVHLESCGLLDIETQTALPSDGIFRIYSMTKPVTAAAVMILYEEGRFLLDDPISQYIREFADNRVYDGPAGDNFATVDLIRPISIRHLLTHTSGIAYGFPADHPLHAIYRDADVMGFDESLSDKMTKLAALPLAHQPGAGWTYGMSIDVLGALVEVVARVPFDEFLATRLFQPLGMADTGFSVPKEKVGRRATLYRSAAGKLTRLDWPHPGGTEDPAFKSGGGGLSSTATDYAHFAQMLSNGGILDGVRILSRKTVELMLGSQMTRDQTPFVPADWPFREGYGMALGGRTLVDVARSGALGTEGTYTWQGAAGTDFWVDPREDIVGVTLVQTIPGYNRPAQIFRVLAYSSLID